MADKSFDGAEDGAESVLQSVEDLNHSLHNQASIIRKSGLGSCLLDHNFKTLCSLLDDIEQSGIVSPLTSEQKSRLADQICEFITALLERCCFFLKSSDMSTMEPTPLKVIDSVWDHLFPYIVSLNMKIDTVMNQFLACWREISFHQQTSDADKQNVLYKLYLFLESNESLLANVDHPANSVLKITDEMIPEIRILILFICSLFISNTSSCVETQPNICIIQEKDIEMIVSDDSSMIYHFSLLQKLKFIDKLSLDERNHGLLKGESVLQLIFLAFTSSENELTSECSIATKVLTALFNDEQNADDESAVSVGISISDTISTLLDDIARHVQEAEGGCSDDDRGLRICSSLQYIVESLQMSNEENESSIIETISSYPFAVNVFCIYLKLHMDHLGNCKASFCESIVLLVGSILVSITNKNEASWNVVIESGLAVKLLKSFRSFVLHEEINKELQSETVDIALMLLHNCFLKIAEYMHHFLGHDFARDLKPYINSPQKNISFNSRVLLLHLGPFLSKQDCEILTLDLTVVKDFVESFRKALTSSDQTATFSCGVSMSAIEIIGILQDASIAEENICLMIENGLLEVILSSVDFMTFDTRQASFNLILSILVNDNCIRNEEVQRKIYDFVQTLNSTSHINKHPLSVAVMDKKKCDIEELTEYSKQCYDIGLYNECKRICLNFLQSKDALDGKTHSEACVLLGKNEYMLYQQCNRRFQACKGPLTERDLVTWNESKFESAKLIIDSLMKNNLVLDDELKKYVDFAMIECALSNNLLKINLCMLCLKHCQKLKRSHIVPKSILQEFRKALADNYQGNRAFVMSDASIERHYSDKTLAKYMLCESCESLLNVKGEQPFYNNFFRKIYNTSNENCLSLSHEIRYEEWLYHFCLGFIFRGIAAFCGIPDNARSGDVHNLFRCCRQYLLNKDDLSLEQLPKVQVFINQTFIPLEYEERWTSSVLLQPATFTMSNHRLDDGVITSYPASNFILAKLGIINIVIDLLSYSDKPMESVIDPCGGSFFVPEDENRVLPVGLLDLYTGISVEGRKRKQNFLFRKDPFAPCFSRGSTPTGAVKSFKLSAAISDDKDKFQQQVNKDGQMFFKCLPSQFILDHRSSEVKFPAPYVPLIHQNVEFVEDVALDGYCLTLFIGVKVTEELNMPFVVVYELNESEVIYFGYTFAPDDYSVHEYITEVPLDSYHYAIRERVLDLVTEFMPITIESVLVRHGFANIASLLFHYQHNFLDCVSLFDNKCVSAMKCWYCNRLCSNCLQPASFGLSQPSKSSDLSLKFCSEKCERLALCSESQYFIQILSKSESHNEDQELFRIQGHFVVADMSIAFSMSVHFCNSEYYVLYCEKDGQYKHFFEFIVSIEGKFLRFLPHSSSLDYAEELVFFTALSTRIEMGFKCFEVYSRGTYNPPTSTSVIIPVGMNFRDDIFFEKNALFPRETFGSVILLTFNSLLAYKIVAALKSEQDLANYLIAMCSAQIQHLLSGSRNCQQLCDLSLDILTQIISELHTLKEKNVKIMTSSFALLLWNIVDCDDYLEVLPDKLIDALLQYLTFRSKDLLHSEELCHEMRQLDVPVFHILRQRRHLSYIYILKLVEVLAVFLQHSVGSIRWAALLILSLHAQLLSNVALLVMLDDDLKFLKAYLCNFSDSSEVILVFQSLLLLPDNRLLLLNSSIMKEICDVVSTRKEVIDEVSELIHCSESSIVRKLSLDNLVENLKVALEYYMSSSVQQQENNEFLTSELCCLMSQLLEMHSNNEFRICDVQFQVSLMISFIKFLTSGVEMQASLELWNHFMKVSIILLHCVEDAKGFLEIIDVVIDFLSNLKQPLLKEKVYLPELLKFLYFLLKESHPSRISVDSLVAAIQPILVQTTVSDNTIRVLCMFILSLFDSYVIEHCPELLSLKDEDLKTLQDSSFLPLSEILKFVNAISFSAANCEVLKSILEFLSLAMDNFTAEPEQELVASIIEKILSC